METGGINRWNHISYLMNKSTCQGLDLNLGPLLCLPMTLLTEMLDSTLSDPLDNPVLCLDFCCTLNSLLLPRTSWFKPCLCSGEHWLVLRLRTSGEPTSSAWVTAYVPILLVGSRPVTAIATGLRTWPLIMKVRMKEWEVIGLWKKKAEIWPLIVLKAKAHASNMSSLET